MHPQRAAALAFLALSVAYLALALRIEDVASSSAAVIGPRGFPLLVGSIGILVSIVLVFAPVSASGPVATGDPAQPTPRRGVFAGDWRRVLALCGSTLLYAVALPILGFTLATTAFLAASFRLLGERRPATLLIVPLAIAIGFLVLLRGGFGAYLPEPLFERVIERLAC